MSVRSKHHHRVIQTIGVLLLIVGLAACVGCQAATDTDSGEHEASTHEESGHVETSGAEVTHGHLRLKGIWSRPGLQGGNGAVYLTVLNTGQEPDRLVGAQTDIAAVAELHQVTMEDEVMTMQPVSGGIEIPAGAQVELEPGGYHFMLIGLKHDLKEGERFPLVLYFEKGGQVAVDVEVLQP